MNFANIQFDKKRAEDFYEEHRNNNAQSPQKIEVITSFNVTYLLFFFLSIPKELANR